MEYEKNRAIHKQSGIHYIFIIFAALNGPVAQLNRASDYGSEGFRFES